ncbi:hypothetical protein [Paucibacter sp. PLA-PC-4]|uniref:hypothetical protein n=1 Tax=Paucibacter sp. PLA-PC-4 TaxID=2993655 RepID=UPI00224A4D3A|nr:hypothetical protein [Paucibacter sp. PLA-PC-4]
MHDVLARTSHSAQLRAAGLQSTEHSGSESRSTRGLATAFLRQRLDLLLRTRGFQPAEALNLSEVKQHLVALMNSAVKPTDNENVRALHFMLPLLLLGMSRDMSATPAQAEMKIARMTAMQRGKV